MLLLAYGLGGGGDLSSPAELCSRHAWGTIAPMDRQVFDARRGLLALGGFLFGVILTKWFGVIGFIALAVLLVVGIPVIAVVGARRTAARASRTPPS